MIVCCSSVLRLTTNVKKHFNLFTPDELACTVYRFTFTANNHHNSGRYSARTRWGELTELSLQGGFWGGIGIQGTGKAEGNGRKGKEGMVEDKMKRGIGGKSGRGIAPRFILLEIFLPQFRFNLN